MEKCWTLLKKENKTIVLVVPRATHKAQFWGSIRIVFNNVKVI